MLPTSYRGNATIDGEIIDAVLRLDDGHLHLTTRSDAEILRWPLHSLAVEATGAGEYRLEAGTETFEFAPLYDDGLGAEIALRARFAEPGPVGAVLTEVKADHEEPGSAHSAVKRNGWSHSRRKAHSELRRAHLSPAPSSTNNKAKPAAPLTVADEILGRPKENRRRRGSLNGGDLSLAAGLAILAILVVAIGAVGLLSQRDSPAPVALEAPPEDVPASTLPFTDGTPDTVPTPAPTPTFTPSTFTPSTTPTTVPPATATTGGPPTTGGEAPVQFGTAFDLTPEQLVANWDTRAAGLEPGLMTSGFVAGDGVFSFEVGEYVSVEGSAGADGNITRLVFLGDPSGDVNADRLVLTSLGLTVAMMEPELPPLGRRQFLAALGLDVDKPDLAGLDQQMEYHGRQYQLRWDPDVFRLVLEGSLPGAAETGPDTP